MIVLLVDVNNVNNRCSTLVVFICYKMVVYFLCGLGNNKDIFVNILLLACSLPGMMLTGVCMKSL